MCSNANTEFDSRCADWVGLCCFASVDSTLRDGGENQWLEERLHQEMRSDRLQQRNFDECPMPLIAQALLSSIAATVWQVLLLGWLVRIKMATRYALTCASTIFSSGKVHFYAAVQALQLDSSYDYISTDMRWRNLPSLTSKAATKSGQLWRF